jgi:hypothetical protein
MGAGMSVAIKGFEVMPVTLSEVGRVGRAHTRACPSRRWEDPAPRSVCGREAFGPIGGDVRGPRRASLLRRADEVSVDAGYFTDRRRRPR